MKTDVSKKFAIDFRASLDKANGERPRDGSGRFGVDREGRGKAREEAKMGTGEAREQIRDLKNQGKPEEAHALEDHLRRMSNRLGEARARMLPDTMHLHGIRPPIPAKRTTFERPEIIVPKEDPISKEGTSEGAKLGWETRRHGGAPEAEKPGEAGKPTETPKEPGKPPERRKDAKGKIIVPDHVADEGADLAQKLNYASNQSDGTTSRLVHLQWSKLKRDQKLIPEAKKADDEARAKYFEARAKSEDFQKKTGVHPVDAWEAKNGKRWPYYKVDSGAGGPPDAVLESKAAKPGEPEKPKELEKPKEPEGPKFETDKKGLSIISDKVAEEGAGIAEDLKVSENEYESARKEQEAAAFASGKGKDRRFHEAYTKFESAKKKVGDVWNRMDDFKKRTGVSVIDAWEAKGGGRWDYQGLKAGPTKFVSESRAEKTKDTEDEDADTEGERETPRRRPLPAEARAVMPVGTKKPPRPPGPPKPKQMRVGPRKIEGPRLMPVTTPRNPTYVEVDR